MSKFCTNCGATLSDDAVFCTSCGTSQKPANQQGNAGASIKQAAGEIGQAAGAFAQNAGNTVKQTFDGVTFDSVKGSMSVDSIKNVGKTKDKNTIIGLCAVGAAVIILVIILACVIGNANTGYKKPIANVFKAIEKTDGKALEDALPEYIVDNVDDDLPDDYDKVSEYYEEEILEDVLDSLEDDYGENVKIKFKVIKKKDIKKSDLNDLEDLAEELYDEKIDVQKGYEVKIKATIKGKEDKDTENMWFNVYKIDGKWCIANIGSLYGL